MANIGQNHNARTRTVSRVLPGLPATDGAGVELTRVIGTPQLGVLDPFLLLDRMHSDRPEDYIAGFPPHPHRGFETVTYLIAGRFKHQDSAGNEGTLLPGGVQWMCAGSGIVHSEMPEQENGLLHGFQLWINLPAAHKMDPPAYQEYGPQQVPEEVHEDGTRIRVVAGLTDRGSCGPVAQPLTEPLYLDVILRAGGNSFSRSTRVITAFCT
jgi:redox-sensitive bicupin YhaK (pirin superfamily)